LKKVDPNLIEQLHYFYKLDFIENSSGKAELKEKIEGLDEEQMFSQEMAINTPLHLAKSNNRSVNIILKYMSEI